MTAYAWMLQQVPVIVAHLRDTMIPLAGNSHDRTRIDGTREQPLPFRLQPMLDADQLWDALTDYGRFVAAWIQPSPYALTVPLRASQDWREAGDAAHTITAWLINHEDRIAALNLNVAGTDDVLFTLISQQLNRYRITPRRLRTRTTSCGTCGADAVYAEWTLNARGEIAQTIQCTRCRRRYDPREVVIRAPHLPASSAAS